MHILGYCFALWHSALLGSTPQSSSVTSSALPQLLASPGADTLHSTGDFRFREDSPTAPAARGIVTPVHIPSVTRRFFDPQRADALGYKLQTRLRTSPPLTSLGDSQSWGSRLLTSLVPGLERYGQGRSPVDEHRSTDWKPSLDPALSPKDSLVRPPLTDYFKMGARFRDFGSGLLGPELEADIEITSPSTNAAGVRLVKSSGDGTFDKWAISQSELANQEISLSTGASAPVQRTTWTVRGRVTRLKSFRDSTSVADGAYMAAAAAAGLFTGHIDPVLGIANYVDIRDARFSCTVLRIDVLESGEEATSPTNRSE